MKPIHRKSRLSPSTVRLKNIILMTSLRCFAVLLLIVVAVMLLLTRNTLRTSQEYANSLVGSIEESIKLIDSNLQTFSSHLAVHEPLASLYASPLPKSTDTMQDIYSTVYLMVNFSDVLRDVAVVSPQGDIRSFVSSLSVDYIEIIMDEQSYDFTSTAHTAPQYFFFPHHESPHDTMFVYLFPLYDAKVHNPQVNRVGTIVFACELENLQNLLNLGLANPYHCALIDSHGQEVLSRTSGDYKDSSANLRASLYASSMDLHIQLSQPSPAWPSLAQPIPLALAMLLLFMLFIVFYFSKVIRRSLTQPINRLVQIMPSVRLQRNHVALPPTHIEELDIIVNSINLMIDQLEEASRNTLKIETKLLETQLRNNEAELYALQSQINPHFLFNTLQCIRSLAILNRAEDVSTVCSSLSAMLRYSIREMQLVSVREEMKIVHQYLKIMDIRHQNRFAHEIDVPESLLDYACPCMIIQPLVENAIIHGVASTDSGGIVRIHGSISDNIIRFEISDNGAGIDDERLHQIQQRLSIQLYDMMESADKYGRSFGLFNIQRRIQLQYGEEFGLTISSEEGWTRLFLRFPATPFSPTPPA